jgi:hypothetical protein
MSGKQASFRSATANPRIDVCECVLRRNFQDDRSGGSWTIVGQMAA